MSKPSRLRRILLPVLLAVVLLGGGYFAVAKYRASQPQLDYTYAKPSGDVVDYPDARFAVISDLHYYDTSLGTSGSAFEEVLGSDRKLLKETAALLTLAIDEILATDVEFVLVPGDMTKDGELVNHEAVAAELSRLTSAGIEVLVIPGNHDVNNPLSYRYEGDKTILVDNVSAEDFAEIYSACGYGDALYRDENSLSYVAEPVEGLWVLAIDSTLSENNQPGEEEIVEGSMNQAQEQWVEQVLGEARAQDKAVICLMHHGVVEHWDGQSKLHSDYLIDDFPYVGKLLASYGVRAAFTGHYHAQDIAQADFGQSGVLYDIETGSLATAPSPLRVCELAGGTLAISSTQLVDDLKPGTDFAEQASDFVFDTVKSEAFRTLRGYKVSEKDSEKIADFVSSAFVAHYSGDEDPADEPDFDTGELGLWSRFIYSQQEYVVEGLWQDPEPADNDIKLELTAK